mmetsp:Transcript_48001/g.79598  ORF Transcript_48001/g.79598 Transcript_48001/m.79598 type:complete len:253 (-) Transcript_48001:117-875(-)
MAEQKEQASFRVRYFGIDGRAAQVRLALILGGFAFVDEFVTGAEHAAAVKAGTEIGLPELVIYGKDGKEVAKLSQSVPILRYIGSLSGLYGENALERLRIDEIMAIMADLYGSISANKDEAKKKEEREAAVAKDGKITTFLTRLQSRLEDNEKAGNKGGFMVGAKLSIADINVYRGFTFLTSGYYEYIPKDLLTKNFPRLDQYAKAISEIDAIKKFNTAFDQRTTDFKDEAKQASVKVVSYPGKSCPDIASK